MKKLYCCDDSRHMYEQYYTQQQNGYGNYPVYVGVSRQQGHGIGNVLGGFFKRIIPTIKTFAPHVMRAGADIFEDVTKGQSFTDAAMQRMPAAISKAVFNKHIQSGSGVRRRRTSCKKKKRIKRDIFS